MRDADNPAKLSYALYRMTSREQWAMLGSKQLENILKQTELPKPQEQLENLILWLGSKQGSTTQGIEITAAAIAAAGARDNPGLGFILEHASDMGLIQGEVVRLLAGDYGFSEIALSFQGWTLYEELKRGHSQSRIAFMAMQFGDPELDSIFQDHFKAGVRATGFELKRLDEGQPAGLIDDRLRVEIRQSRFLVADLTHQNRGAYWEAGYAEGLGKPVIYTCRKDAFKKEGTHFDTNHHLTVIWDPDNMGEAVERLKATIRRPFLGKPSWAIKTSRLARKKQGIPHRRITHPQGPL